ncbi:probable chitinase 10 [Scaptodrosophila lebanonensis]|uniref:Probable chitinase 10 n=1 Tax=Drosophila lebanonensis TaxID=7225 RepID=A0A6J2TKL3_DROLE|nr:probable chitinase 10 [Scaptodrosophila lebanonensis]
MTTARILRKPISSVSIRQNIGGLCQNHLVGEFVEHTEDCQLFYLCVENGEAVLATCPSTMLFNPESKLCDTESNVRCKNITTGIENIVSTPPNSIENFQNNEVTYMIKYCTVSTSHQNDNTIIYMGSSTSCSQYYICYHGQPILQTCSEELHWNAVTGKCDLPELAQCTLKKQEPSKLQVDNEFIHCPDYGQHLFPHMQRCEFFIYCVKGHATLQQCPFYYYFDVNTKSCQWSRTAMCVRDLELPLHSR